MPNLHTPDPVDEVTPSLHGDIVARFLQEIAEPLRAQQKDRDAARPNPLPVTSQLLAQELKARRISVQRVTAGRWTFSLAGTIIGGFAGNVTTLVSAHARQVLARPDSIRAIFTLMEVPHPVLPEVPEAEDGTPPLFGPEVLITPGDAADTLSLRAYVVGRTAVSILAVVPHDETHALTVDITDHVDPELATLACDALRAIPGLHAGEVALRTPRWDSAEGAMVVGIDEAASIRPHHFPELGPGRPVAAAIAEQILINAAP